MFPQPQKRVKDDALTRLQFGRDGTGVSRAAYKAEKNLARKESAKGMSTVYLQYKARNHKGGKFVDALKARGAPLSGKAKKAAAKAKSKKQGT